MSRITLRAGILAAWLLVVAVALFAIQGYERTLLHGEPVLLRLAPVDPRSLMQGDYMALRFAADSRLIDQPAEPGEASRSLPGFAHFKLDDRGRGDFDGMGDTPRTGTGTISMRIRMIDGAPSVGPNAFFFQEGTGELYEEAQWGGFRVAGDGAALLESLHDADLKKIGSQRR